MGRSHGRSSEPWLSQVLIMDIVDGVFAVAVDDVLPVDIVVSSSGP